MKKTTVLMIAAVLGLAACSGAPTKSCNPMKEECVIGDEPKTRTPSPTGPQHPRWAPTPTQTPGSTAPKLLQKDRVGGFYI
jgi:ABC-type glycerol-3-phosphate transport system substrate-binding protein